MMSPLSLVSTVYSDGTWNSDASGAARLMLVRLVVTVPIRGSVWVVVSGSWRSVEYQRSVTTWMGFSLPILPAGMVRVTRVPVACRPLMVFAPKGSRATLALSGLGPASPSGGGGGPCPCFGG